MKMIKIWIAMVVLLSYDIAANAYSFQVDGIYYNITNSATCEVAVTYKDSYGSYSEEVVIPTTVTFNEVEYRVVGIGERAFSGCSNLVSISIPKSVTSIAGSAFAECTGKLIVNCNIPSANHYVNAPFYNSKFTSVIVGDGVRFVGDKAFYECESLLEIILPNSLSYIGSSAFVNCTNLSSIHIPKGVASIKDFTFYGCTNLTNITLPEALDSIGQDAFSGCESLESVTIPDCVNYIGYSALSGCSALTTSTFLGLFVI